MKKKKMPLVRTPWTLGNGRDLSEAPRQQALRQSTAGTKRLPRPRLACLRFLAPGALPGTAFFLQPPHDFCPPHRGARREVDITLLLANYLQSPRLSRHSRSRRRGAAGAHGGDPPTRLLDLGLPGEDGFPLPATSARKLARGLVIVTGAAIRSTSGGPRSGCDDYVTNPSTARAGRACQGAAAPTDTPEAPVLLLSPRHAARAPALRRLATGHRRAQLSNATGRGRAADPGEFDCCAPSRGNPGRVLSRDFCSSKRAVARRALRSHDRCAGRPAAQEVGPTPTIRSSSSRCAAQATSCAAVTMTDDTTPPSIPACLGRRGRQACSV